MSGGRSSSPAARKPAVGTAGVPAAEARSAVGIAFAVTVVALTAAGCSSIQSYQDNRVTVIDQLTGAPQAVAVARLTPVEDSRVEGRVTFSQYGAIVVVRGTFFGLQRNRDYGLHVHERGDCTAAAGTGIGGHFNPRGAPHGRYDREPRHAGDLPNVSAQDEATVMYSFQTMALTVGEGPTSVIGRSVVLSRNPDDYQTQPDGNSGGALACGFIRPG